MVIPQASVRARRTVGLSIATEILWMERDFREFQITAAAINAVNRLHDAFDLISDRIKARSCAELVGSSQNNRRMNMYVSNSNRLELPGVYNLAANVSFLLLR